MKIYLTIIILLVLYGNMLSQVTGVVTDDDNFIEFANIVLYSNDTSNIEMFTASDSLGKWVLQPKESATYVLKISSLGYNPFYQAIEYIKDEPILIKSNLTSSEYLLPEIAIKEKRLSIVIKGDTINYNVKAFDDLKPRNLGEVLSELPGIHISDRNEIIYMGKPIQTILLDGHDIVKNKSQLLEGINADDIVNIQIIENYKNPDNPFSLNESDEVALNVELDSSSNWNGQIGAAVGIPKDYKSNLDLYNTDAFSATTIFFRSHTIPRPLISSYEYLAIQSNLSQNLGQGLVNRQFLPIELDIPQSTNENTDHGLTINSINKINNKLRYSTSIIAGNNSRISESSSTTTSILDGTSQVISNNDSITNLYLLANAKINYDPGINSNIILNIPFNILKSDQQNSATAIDQISNSIEANHVKETLNKEFAPNISLNKKINDDLNFQLKYQYVYQDNKNEIALFSNTQLLDLSSIPLINDSFTVDQSHKYLNSNSQISFKLNWRFKEKSFINMLIRHHSYNQKILPSSNSLGIDDSFIQEDQIKFSRSFVELEYVYETKKSSIKFSLQNNVIDYSGLMNPKSRFEFLPHINLKTIIHENYEINFQISQKLNLATLNNLSPVNKIYSPYILKTGNPSIEPIVKKTLIGILLSKRDKSNLNNFFNLLIRYNYQKKGFQPSVDLQNRYQIWSYREVFKVRNFESFLLLTRSINSKLTLNTDIQFNSIIQNLNLNNDLSQRLKLLNLRVKLNYKLHEKMKLWFGVNAKYSNSSSDNIEIESTEIEPTTGIRYVSDKMGIFELQFSSFRNQNTINSVNNYSLKINYEFLFSENFSFYLDGDDLLQWNSRRGINVLTDQNFVTIDSYNVNQSYILIGIKYKL